MHDCLRPAEDRYATDTGSDATLDPSVDPHPTSSVGHDDGATLSSDGHRVVGGPITPAGLHERVATGLSIQTNLLPRSALRAVPASPAIGEGKFPRSSSTAALVVGSPSLKTTSARSLASLTPPSLLSSPALGSMVDITPLPSPILPGQSPGPWTRRGSRPHSCDMSTTSSPGTVLIAANGESISSAMASQQKRKSYHGITSKAGLEAKPANAEHLANLSTHSHARTRDVSEYVPDPVQVRRPRHVTVSDSGGPRSADSILQADCAIQREQHVAAERGVTVPVVQPPTPPPSNPGAESDVESPSPALGDGRVAGTTSEIFEATGVKLQQRRSWKAVRLLGVGSFSRVILATSQDVQGDPMMIDGGARARARARDVVLDEQQLDPRQLVAVKVIEHGPAGGADEERLDVSLKRELDILKTTRHPSLVHLKAFSIESTRALLVLGYCPGGDMYDVASQQQALLVPSLIRRIFAELVAATAYLHAQLVVHRDIKLENVLLNVRHDQLASVKDWRSYPYAVVTLTDLGLSRRIDPADPKLHTRCGSEDYAAPELLMGQAYDGRQTDAWALGVLLYAIMEGRLPFDPLPGASEQQRMRSRTIHRIARCDWAWCKFADEGGEPGDFGELDGARHVVEGLLRRASSRFSLDKVASQDWVQHAIQVEGGVRFEESDEEEL
ncbi:MAG: hypothetical protein M1838_004850 [Thelocarpon superellum]|nr:MAG: hypothetical protein M1838_004850 [Thelocarpon superellum]